MVVTGRGGKASSKLHKDYFNVSDGEQGQGVYLDKVEWRIEEAANETDNTGEDEEESWEDANVVMIPVKDHGKEECIKAKEKELKAFEDFAVYEEVEDKGQERLSSRWILTDKSTMEERKVKARLVCRGFEESVQVQSDSPTGSRETLHMVLAVAASKNWKIKSGDVKSAYLQGEWLDREVHMEPPKEKRKDNVLWKLKKSVYGMNDAGRKWFFKVEETLVTLGCGKSKFDHCLFYYREKNDLTGLILLFVDDIFYAGMKTFEERIMVQVSQKFMIGRTEEETFQYIGLKIETTKEGITLDQIEYIKERMEPAVLPNGDNQRPLQKEETKLLRRLTGKINWAATQSRPDMSYDVVELSTRFKQATLGDLKKANKCIVRLASNPVKVVYPKLSGNLRIEVFCDAAFRNLPDQISSGRGHIILLVDEKNRSAPIGWTSNKVKRVVGSTIAAEALSLQIGLAHASFLRAILTEMLGVDMYKIPIVASTDSNNLYQAIYSTKFVEDKKLRIDIAQIQEAVEKENAEIKWVEAGNMIADCLTKKGAMSDMLMDTIKTGRLFQEAEKKRME